MHDRKRGVTETELYLRHIVNRDDMGRGGALLFNHPPSKCHRMFYWVSFVMPLAWHLSWDVLADASFPCCKAVCSGGHDKRDSRFLYVAPSDRTISLTGIII